MEHLTRIADGLSFRHTCDMKVQQFPRGSRGLNIRIEGPGVHGRMFGVVIMTYAQPVGADAALRESVQGLEMVYSMETAKILKREPVARTIAGAQRQGERFNVEWEGKPVMEVFAFELGGRTLCVSVQHDADDSDRAEKLLPGLLESIKLA